MKAKFSNYELAGLIWETMYPDRKCFKDISSSAKAEWVSLAEIARDYLIIESESDNKLVEFLKNKITV